MTELQVKHLVKEIKQLKWFGLNIQQEGFEDAKKRIIELIKAKQ